MEKLFDYEPVTVALTAEPSLREIVNKYYSQHFDYFDALRLTNAYLAKYADHIRMMYW